MGGSEQNFIAVGTEKGARGFADAGRDPVAVAGFQVEHINLVEWVTRLAFALENQRLAVGRKVTFAAASAFEGELANV